MAGKPTVAATELNDENVLPESVSEITTPNSGEQSNEERIKELNIALSEVERNFNITKIELRDKACMWILICFAALFLCSYLSILLLNIDFGKYNHIWTWEIAFFTSIRLLIAGVVISLLAFCFKMLRSYIHMVEQNRHKITVIKSMAYLVGAGKDQKQRDLIYATLTQIIVDFGNVGILSQDNDFSKTTSYMELTEKLLKFKPEQ